MRPSRDRFLPTNNTFYIKSIRYETSDRRQCLSITISEKKCNKEKYALYGRKFVDAWPLQPYLRLLQIVPIKIWII